MYIWQMVFAFFLSLLVPCNSKIQSISSISSLKQKLSTFLQSLHVNLSRKMPHEYAILGSLWRIMWESSAFVSFVMNLVDSFYILYYLSKMYATFLLILSLIYFNIFHMKNRDGGLKNWLSGYEQGLFFPRTLFWFRRSTSQLSMTPASGSLRCINSDKIFIYPRQNKKST